MRIGIVTGEYPPMQGGIGAHCHILAQTWVTQGHDVFVISHISTQSNDSNIHLINSISAWNWSSLGQVNQWTNDNHLDIVNLHFQTAAFAMSPWIHFLPHRLDVPLVTTFHDLRFPYLFPKAGRLRTWIVKHLAKASNGVIVTNHEDYFDLWFKLTGIRFEPSGQYHPPPETPIRLIPIGSSILVSPPPSPPRFQGGKNIGDSPQVHANENVGDDSQTDEANLHLTSKSPLQMERGLEQNSFRDAVSQRADEASLVPTESVGTRRRQTLNRIGIQDDEIIIAHFGFINHSKGVNVLLDALAKLKNDMPFKLVMIGGRTGSNDPTNQAFVEGIDHQIEQLGLSENVFWTGFVDSADVSAYLQLADIVALPFLDGASYRRSSLMAAIQHECAIVTTEPKIPIETFQQGRNLYLVPANDVDALEWAIAELAQRPELREKLRIGTRELKQHFDWNQIASDNVTFFEHILGA